MGFEVTREIVAGNTLIAEAIQSQNFVTTVSGWQIAANGNAEFNNVTVRGTFITQGSDGSMVKIDAGTGRALITIKPPDYSGITPLPVSNPGYIRGEIANIAAVGWSQLVIGGPFPDTQVAPTITMGSYSIDGVTSSDFISFITSRAIFTTKVLDGNASVYSPGYNGTVNVSFTAVTSFTVAVPFPRTMGGIPKIMTNIDSGAGAAAQWHSRAISATANGFTLLVFAAAAGTWSNIPVSWAAFLQS